MTSPGFSLDVFWELTSVSAEKRSEALRSLLSALRQNPGEVPSEEDAAEDGGGVSLTGCGANLAYTVKRLVVGLASSRASARQGFAAALTQTLREFAEVPIENTIRLVDEHSQVSGKLSGFEEREVYIGQLFGYVAVLGSGRASATMEMPSSPSGENVLLLEHIARRAAELARQKPYLGQLAFAAIEQCMAASDKKSAVSHILPAVAEALHSAEEDSASSATWSGRSASELQLALAVSLRFGTKALARSKAFPALPLDDPEAAAEILAGPLKDSSSAHPALHGVWRELWRVCFEENAVLGDADARQALFCAVWEHIVDGEMAASSHERKYAAFLLVKATLPLVRSSGLVSIVLGRNIVANLRVALATSKAKLHAAADDVVSHMIAECERRAGEGDSKFARAVAYSLSLGPHGDPLFDAATRLRPVQKCAGLVRGAEAAALAQELLPLVAQPSRAAGATDAAAAPRSAFAIRDLAIALLATLARRPGDLGPEIASSLATALFGVAFYDIRAKAPASVAASVRARHDPPLDAGAHKRASARFFTALHDLVRPERRHGGAKSKSVASAEVQAAVLRGVMALWKALDGAGSRVAAPVSALSHAAQDSRARAEKTVEKLLRSEKATDRAMAGLVVHVSLLLFQDPEAASQALGVLEEAAVARGSDSSGKQSSAGNDDMGPFFQCLLSLLERPSSAIRDAVRTVFSASSSDASADTLQHILDVVISPVVAQEEEGEDDSGDEDEDDEESESSEEEESDSASGDESDDAASSGAPDLAEESQPESSRQASAESSDGDDDDFDILDEDVPLEEADEEELAAYDRALAAHVRLVMERRDAEHARRASIRSSVHFRLRALDLLDVYFAKEPTSAHVLLLGAGLVRGGVESFRAAGTDSERQLAQRMLATVRNRLVKARSAPRAVSADDISDSLAAALEALDGAADRQMSELVSLFVLYIGRVAMATSRARETAKRTSDLRADPVIAPFLDGAHTLVDSWLTSRGSPVSGAFFRNLADRIPILAALVAEDIAESASRARNQFLAADALETLAFIARRVSRGSLDDYGVWLAGVTERAFARLATLLTENGSGEETGGESGKNVKARRLRTILQSGRFLVQKMRASAATELETLLGTGSTAGDLRQAIAATMLRPESQQSQPVQKLCTELLELLTASSPGGMDRGAGGNRPASDEADSGNASRAGRKVKESKDKKAKTTSSKGGKKEKRKRLDKVAAAESTDHGTGGAAAAKRSRREMQ